MKLKSKLYILSSLFLVLSLFDHFEWLIFFALVPLMQVMISDENNSHFTSFKYGFLAQFFFSLCGFYWIKNAGVSYFGLSEFFAHVFYFIFCALLSLHWGFVALTFSVYKKAIPHQIKWHYIFLPLSFVFYDEIIFKFIPFHFGFHWYQLQWFGLNWARVVGLSNLGCIVILVNLSILLILKKESIKIGILIITCVMGGLYFEPKDDESSKKIAQFNVTGIQGHVNNETKKNDLQQVQAKMLTIDKYYSLTKKALSENAKTDLVVWPETALPVIWNSADSFQADVESFSKRYKINILSGAYYQNKGLSNSVVFIDSEKGFQSHSEKNILFPIGEVIPFNDFGGLTINMFPEVPRFQQNTRPTLHSVNTKATIQALTPICYEALFTSYFLEYLNNANLIINLTNDSWFQSSLQKKWHLLMTLSHSVQFNKPVFRLANDGLSGYAKENGKFEIFDSEKSAVFAAIEINQNQKTTYFQKNGEWLMRIPRVMAYILFFFVMIFNLISRKKLSTARTT